MNPSGIVDGYARSDSIESCDSSYDKLKDIRVVDMSHDTYITSVT